MNEVSRNRSGYRVIVGAMLIAMGVLMLLDRFVGIDFGGFGTWWPLLLVGMGVWKLSEVREGESRRGAVWLILIGGIFLVKPVMRLFGGREFVDEFHIWPLFIVAVGIFIVWRALSPPSRRIGDSNDAP